MTISTNERTPQAYHICQSNRGGRPVWQILVVPCTDLDLRVAVLKLKLERATEIKLNVHRPRINLPIVLKHALLLYHTEEARALLSCHDNGASIPSPILRNRRRAQLRC